MVIPREEGTPQEGPLSPLLSNLYLNELDKELERRGHRFVRYADDCNIYVKSERTGQRVKENIRRWIEKKLKLKVNENNSAVDRVKKRKFLGFSFMMYKSEAAVWGRGLSAELRRYRSLFHRVTLSVWDFNISDKMILNYRIALVRTRYQVVYQGQPVRVCL